MSLVNLMSLLIFLFEIKPFIVYSLAPGSLLVSWTWITASVCAEFCMFSLWLCDRRNCYTKVPLKVWISVCKYGIDGLLSHPGWILLGPCAQCYQDHDPEQDTVVTKDKGRNEWIFMPFRVKILSLSNSIFFP